MTYKRAKMIQALIDDIDSSWEKSNYAAAIKNEGDGMDRWSVYLYSREGYSHQLMELAGLALSLDNIACNIHYRMAQYNKATYGEDMVQAIQIW